MAESEPNPVATQDGLWKAECARRTLLSHLGITPLVSRFDPVAAKPAQRLGVPTGFNDVTSMDDPATSNSDDEMRAAQLREMLPATSWRDVTSDTPFSLLFVISDDVLWVEVLEDQLLRQEQLQLIAAMARAIRGASVRCAHQQFDWPPAAGSAIAAAGGMDDMLSGFLQRLTSDHATRHLVQLGDCQVIPDCSLLIHRVPSSLEMLREGSLKQSAWSVLKLLRAGD
jgi:hypothetical protein